MTCQQEQPPRWKQCFLEMEQFGLGMLIGRYFVQKKFSEEDKNDLNEFFEHLKGGFLEIVKEDSWLDDKTRTQAIDKANKLIHMMGFPGTLHLSFDISTDNWNSFSILFDEEDNLGNIVTANNFLLQRKLSRGNLPYDLNNWDFISYDLLPYTVTAYNVGSPNAILVPAGIVQVPSNVIM